MFAYAYFLRRKDATGIPLSFVKSRKIRGIVWKDPHFCTQVNRIFVLPGRMPWGRTCPTYLHLHATRTYLHKVLITVLLLRSVFLRTKYNLYHFLSWKLLIPNNTRADSQKSFHPHPLTFTIQYPLAKEQILWWSLFHKSSDSVGFPLAADEKREYYILLTCKLLPGCGCAFLVWSGQDLPLP